MSDAAPVRVPMTPSAASVPDASPGSPPETTQQSLVNAASEIQHLRNTVSAMREQLETVRFAEQQKAQQAVATANEELVQLRATVQALRDEMERQKAKFEDAVQSAQNTARSEMKQLQLTIVELRHLLEVAGGK